MWNYIVQIIKQKRGQHIEGSPSPDEQQQDPLSGRGNERKQFHKSMGPEDIGQMKMLTDTDQLKSAAASYGGESGGGFTGEFEMAQPGSTVSLPSSSSAPTGASGVFELEGAGGMPQSSMGPTAAGGLYNQPPPSYPPQTDVFGGAEYGQKASEAAKALDPEIVEYVQNAMKNYARNKIGKRIAGKAYLAADVANAFGEGNRTETGKQLESMGDWFYGSDRKTRKEARQARGLYNY